MEYEPDNWKYYNFTPGILTMLTGACGYIGSLYVIFLIQSSWLSWSLGSTMLALSVLLIIVGYNALQRQQKRRTRLYTNRLQHMHQAASSSSGPLVPRSDSDH